MSRKCHTSRECIGETSIVYAYVKGATVECVYLGWLRPPPGAPQQQWCLRECECDVRVDRHATTHGVSYAIRTIFSPFLSQKTVQRCRSRTGAVSTHYVSVLSITQRRLHLGILRTTHHVSAYYVSSAESPPERAMYYALRIRIMYQAPKARRRELWSTHYVSVLYIKRRTITRGEHNIHDPRSTRDRPETDPRPTRDRPEIDPRLT